MNVTEKQKNFFLQYMKEHRDFARGRLRYNSENKRKLDDMWLSVSNSLNAVANGPNRQPKEWQKTWRDWKANVLKKCAKNKSYAGGTGGGPPKVIHLTDIGENLLEIIDPESAGLENIPEGGNFERLSSDISSRNKIPGEGNFKRLRDISSRNNIPEGEFFGKQSLTGSSKRTTEGCPKELAARSIENKRIRTSVAVRNEMPRARNFPCEPSRFLIGSGFDEVDDSYELDFVAAEEESTSTPNANIEGYIFEPEMIVQGQKTPGVPLTTDVHHQQNIEPSNHNGGSARTQSNARTAIELMRERMELLREQVASTRNYQDRMIQIEEEKLKIAKENLELKKEIAEHLRNIHGDIDIVLRNVDNNVTRLREDVEKIAPSYLE